MVARPASSPSTAALSVRNEARHPACREQPAPSSSWPPTPPPGHLAFSIDAILYDAYRARGREVVAIGVEVGAESRPHILMTPSCPRHDRQTQSGGNQHIYVRNKQEDGQV